MSFINVRIGTGNESDVKARSRADSRTKFCLRKCLFGATHVQSGTDLVGRRIPKLQIGKHSSVFAAFELRNVVDRHFVLVSTNVHCRLGVFTIVICEVRSG